MGEARLTKEADAEAQDRPESHGEIRLSFGYFYVLMRWGKERRASARVDAERKLYPVLTATNLPVLMAAWLAIILLSYFALKAVLTTLVFAAS
jgi:hypothetical protein